MEKLLKILHDTIKAEKSFRGGMCYYVYKLYHDNKITITHRVFLNEYLHNNIPLRVKIRFGDNSMYVHWWKPGRKLPRLRWLKKHMKKSR